MVKASPQRPSELASGRGWPDRQARGPAVSGAWGRSHLAHVQEEHSPAICRAERASEITRPTRCTHRESKIQRGQVDGATLHSCLVVGQARPAPNGPPIGWITSGSTAAKAGQRGIYLPGPSLILVLVPGRASRSLDTRWIPGPGLKAHLFQHRVSRLQGTGGQVL